MQASKSLYKIISNENLKRISHLNFIKNYIHLKSPKNQCKCPRRKFTTNTSITTIETPIERVKNYWTPHLENLNKEESKLLSKDLDLNYILGIHPDNGKKAQTIIILSLFNYY